MGEVVEIKGTLGGLESQSLLTTNFLGYHPDGQYDTAAVLKHKKWPQELQTEERLRAEYCVNRYHSEALCVRKGKRER